MKNMNFARLVTKRQKKSCVGKSFRDIYKDKNCNFIYTNSPWDVTDVQYMQDEYPIYIQGLYDLYDNSGYYIDLKLSDSNIFHRLIDKLKAENFEDQMTVTMQLSVNMYYTNLDLVIMYRLILEYNDGYIRVVSDYGLVDLTPLPDNYLYATIVLSFPVIGYFIYSLKNKDVFFRAKEKKDCITRIRMSFKKPDLFVILSKIY
jgi:hypothetical protein